MVGDKFDISKFKKEVEPTIEMIEDSIVSHLFDEKRPTVGALNLTTPLGFSVPKVGDLVTHLLFDIEGIVVDVEETNTYCTIMVNSKGGLLQFPLRHLTVLERNVIDI